MSISRRDFLHKTLVAAVGGGFLFPKDAKADIGITEASIQGVLANNERKAKSNRDYPFNIVQGPTNESITQLTVDLPKDLDVTYHLFEESSGRELNGQIISSRSRNFSTWRVDQIYFTGLKLGENYFFQVVDKKLGALDERELSALDTQKTNARIALGSCMWDMNVFKDEMWESLENSRPDAVFLLGDNVYADFLSTFHSPKIMWYRYIASRRFISFYHWRRLVPTFATWDDHDYGANDATAYYKHREHSLDVFKTFYPRTEIPGFFTTGPGVSSAFDLFGYRVVFFDGRYFRDLPSQHGGRALIGDEQLAWASSVMTATHKPLWLGLGTQFFGKSYQSKHEGEFDALMGFCASLNRPLIFSSGDVHFSETVKANSREFGFNAYELTSSSMHSVPNLKLPKNPKRVDGSTQENFLLVDLAEDQSGYEVTCVGRRGRTRFSRWHQFEG
jgi:alkaline phosphatase D